MADPVTGSAGNPATEGREDGQSEAMTPGRMLRVLLADRGWSQAQLAWVLNRPPQMVSEVITGKKRITTATAEQLEAALGLPARVWLLLQVENDLTAAVPARDTRPIGTRKGRTTDAHR